MANNKVVLSDGTTLIDLTEDTVTASTLLAGITAHGADGSQITGTAVGGKIATGEETLSQDTNSIDWPSDTGEKFDFTPTGILFMRVGTTAARQTQTTSSSKLIAYLRIGNTYWTMHSYDGDNTFRTFRGTSQTAFVSGHIIYSTSTADFILSAGKWKWVAWATDTAQTRGLMSAEPEEIYGNEER